MAQLRAHDVAQTCPTCREELPDGLDGLYALAVRSFTRIEIKVRRGEISYSALPAAEQRELEGFVAMVTECAAHGMWRAQGALGNCHYYGRGVKQDLAKSFTLYKQAAQQGHHYGYQHNVGEAYENGWVARARGGGKRTNSNHPPPPRTQCWL